MKRVFLMTLFVSFVFIGCGSNTTNSKNSETRQTAMSKQNSEVKVVSSENKIKDTSKKAIENTKESVNKLIKKSGEIIAKTGDSKVTKSIGNRIKEETKTIINIVPSKTLSTVKMKNSVDVKKLFAKCAGCHGQKGEKKALGVSKIINKLSAKEIEDALNGYKKGTFGGNMKGIMQGQAATLSEKDIKAIASYISNLK